LRSSNSNRPLGIESGIDPKGCALKLSAGDILISITDGIIEQVNSKGIEFGENRFASIIKENKHSGIAVMKDSLLSSLYLYRGTQPQHDDMTVVMIEYKGSTEEIKSNKSL
ncbi:MAG: SpoIIE family protein phosphatase, partial [Brevinematales bacterium]